MTTPARDVLLEVLLSEGVTHVFGNPGTTELPLIDALAHQDDISYVLALQEATAVGMADGYARARGRPAFVNLHTAAGLGNAMGNLTNARANGAPLVVTAGQQDRRHLLADPLLSGDLVGLAAPVSKWARELISTSELAPVLRRAFHDAVAPPPAPVFVSIPMDLLDAEVDASVPPASVIDHAVLPYRLREMAELLTEVDREDLAIVAGDEVATAGAVPELVALAEALGVPVFGAPLHGAMVFPTEHPLWAGMLGPAAAMVRSALAGRRRVLVVGGQAFLVYPYTPGPVLPPECDLLHLSPDPAQLGRTHPVRLGLTGDPRAALRALVPMVRERVDPGASRHAAEVAGARSRALISEFEEKALGRYGDVPMHPMAAVHALLRALPPDTTVVDESVTAGVYVRGFHRPRDPGTYWFCRGGGLGWAMPASLGVSLARDREPVLCVVGDGSAMYSPQALWTAAREGLPVLFAVLDNRQYLILKQNLRARGTAPGVDHPGMDLVDPDLDFLNLARSMGVEATSVEKAGDVGDAARAAVDSGQPHLLHLPVAVP